MPAARKLNAVIALRTILFLIMLSLVVVEIPVEWQFRWQYLTNWGVYISFISTILNLLCSLRHKKCLENFEKAIDEENPGSIVENKQPIPAKTSKSASEINEIVQKIEMAPSSSNWLANLSSQPGDPKLSSINNPFRLYKWTVILFNIAIVYEIVIVIGFWLIILPGIMLASATSSHSAAGVSTAYIVVAGALDTALGRGRRRRRQPAGDDGRRRQPRAGGPPRCLHDDRSGPFRARHTVTQLTHQPS